jgi:hypothetical protein
MREISRLSVHLILKLNLNHRIFSSFSQHIKLYLYTYVRVRTRLNNLSGLYNIALLYFEFISSLIYTLSHLRQLVLANRLAVSRQIRW